MRDVAVAYADVVNDVRPLPACTGGNQGRAVHEILEQDVYAGDAQPFVARPFASLTHVLEYLADILRKNRRVIVERDDDVLFQQPLYLAFLVFRHRIHVRLDPADLFGQFEGLVIHPWLQVLERSVSLVGFPFHGFPLAVNPLLVLNQDSAQPALARLQAEK